MFSVRSSHTGAIPSVLVEGLLRGVFVVQVTLHDAVGLEPQFAAHSGLRAFDAAFVDDLESTKVHRKLVPSDEMLRRTGEGKYTLHSGVEFALPARLTPKENGSLCGSVQLGSHYLSAGIFGHIHPVPLA